MIKKRFSSLFFIAIALTTSALVFAKEPTNLATYKQELVRYHDSGQYEKDINKSMDDAIRYLKAYIASHPSSDGKKPVIILDIDETSLSNYANMRDMSFGGTVEEINQAEDQGKDTVIASTLKLYQLAKANHIAVIFLSGRLESERDATIRNLQQVGYHDWDGLILRSEQYKKAKAVDYKTAMRKQLSEQGYDIILNIGDQVSDLRGGYAGKTVKLSNPYYLIP